MFWYFPCCFVRMTDIVVSEFEIIQLRRDEEEQLVHKDGAIESLTHTDMTGPMCHPHNTIPMAHPRHATTMRG